MVSSFYAQEALAIMAPAIANELNIEQLRQLANDAPATLAQLPAVLVSLVGQDEERMQWACEALENCGPPSADQVQQLIPYLKHSDALVTTWTCKLLARMGSDSIAAQPKLVELLRHHADPLVQEEAARALGKQGGLSADAQAALEQAVTDGGPRLKRLATAALGR